MNKKSRNFFLSLSLLSVTSFSLAADLLDSYRAALTSDPTWQAAQAARLSSQEALPQSLAGILPTLNLTANTTGNRVQGGQTSGSVARFNSHGYQLNLTQPLFNFANWIKIRQASALVKQADAQYAAAAQDLILRVAQAYFNVLQAEDDLRFIEAQQTATARQLLQARQRFQVGTETMTTVYQAQATYDAFAAQAIAAKNAILNNQENLRQITGNADTALVPLAKGQPPLLNPVPNNSAQWVTTATQQNFTLLAARYNTDAAKQAIKINFSGHLPTVNAVGTHGNNTGFNSGFDSVNTGSTQTSTIGLQLTVPIFSGGLTSSQTRQAQYDYDQASAHLEASYRDTQARTRETFNNVTALINKVKADKLAVLSNTSALAATTDAFKVGTRTYVDVLVAQQNLLQAQRNLAQDQYAYLINTLQLKALAGALTEQDLGQINAWLSPTSQSHSLSN